MTQYSTTDEICFQLDINDAGFLSENPPKVIYELTPYFKLYNPDYWVAELKVAELKIHFDVDVSHSPAYWSDVTGGSPEEHSDERTVTHAELILTAEAVQPKGILLDPNNLKFPLSRPTEEIKHVHEWAYGKNAPEYENRIIYAIQDAFAKTIQESEVHFPEPDDKYDTAPRV